MGAVAMLRESASSLVIAFVALAALFVPLERTFAARLQGHVRPGLRLDLAYFAFQYLLMTGVLLAFNAWLQATIGPGPRALAGGVRALPLAVQVAIVVVSGDLLLYWAHRASHEIPILWRFHSVHHSATHLDWIAAHREHPLDGLWSQLWLGLPAFFLGVDVQAVAPVFVLRGLWAVFVHSNVRIPLGPLGELFGDPVLHRWHHARVARCRHNFANLAPYLDRLFGTHHRPADESFALGMDAPVPATLVGQIVQPFVPDAGRRPGRSI